MAVVVSAATSELSSDEEVSFRHLQHYLGRYDKFVITSDRRPLALPDCEPKPFPDEYFASARNYGRLTLSSEFYEAFADYEYILVYHLDALVFSDELEGWCDEGFDYIGAPWLKRTFDPGCSVQDGFAGVGNGGFSLRRVSAMLSVLRSPRKAVDPIKYWNKHYGSRSALVRLLNLPKRYLLHLRRFNGVERELAGITYNEDLYWAYRAKWFNPDFRFAPVDVALRFAFEEEPRFCFERNDHVLPFGCHAWPKYDRAFWEPYLLA